jgi:hypothetical protein
VPVFRRQHYLSKSRRPTQRLGPPFGGSQLRLPDLSNPECPPCSEQ